MLFRPAPSSEDGFIPLIAIAIVVIASTIGGVVFYLQSKPEKTSQTTQTTPLQPPQPTFNSRPTPDIHTNTELPIRETKINHSPTPQPTQPIHTAQVQSSPYQTQPVNNLNQQFQALEDELTSAKNNSSFFSPSHSDRITSDLLKLESQGYQKTEIERLRQLVFELSPHLQDQAKTTTTASPQPSNCTSSSSPTLVADITDFSKIQKITAPGSESSEGPKGHSFVWTNGQRVPVYAPIDAILESGAYSRDAAESPAQYNLTFNVKNICDFKFRFDHIDEPIDTIRSALPSTPKTADSRGTFLNQVIEFKAGDLIGYTKGNIPSGNWDFGLYDMSKEGALAQYGTYGLHRNAVCWIDFYSPEKKENYRRLLEGPKLVCNF